MPLKKAVGTRHGLKHKAWSWTSSDLRGIPHLFDDFSQYILTKVIKEVRNASKVGSRNTLSSSEATQKKDKAVAEYTRLFGQAIAKMGEMGEAGEVAAYI